MTARPPTELWLGMRDGEWPVYAFESEGHALDWLKERDKDPERARRTRRVWKVRIADPAEMKLVEPVPYLTYATEEAEHQS